MGIYRINNSNNSILYSKIFVEEFIFNESPSTYDMDFGKNGVVSFQFMVNSSNVSKHGLRLKTSHINGNRIEISIDIDEKTGAPTLVKDRSSSRISSKLRKDIVILSGAFAMYSLDYLRKAYGYYSDIGYMPGDESFVVCIKKASENFNKLSKDEKDKYLRKSKSMMKIE